MSIAFIDASDNSCKTLQKLLITRYIINVFNWTSQFPKAFSLNNFNEHRVYFIKPLY